MTSYPAPRSLYSSSPSGGFASKARIQEKINRFRALNL
jgi:hypothetical protein